ncbi:MAG: hypothetical protein QM790_21035 [Nibricoccus sp.]
MSLQLETASPNTYGPPRPNPWGKVLLITAVALGIYTVVRLLPTGTNLSHMDFRAGAGSIEFCDPANPQFLPVVSVRSPVAMTLVPNGSTEPLQPMRMTLQLKTLTGKAIAPEDLLVVHTEKLHLLIVDPTLQDYQHVHPAPGALPGEWAFSFTPRRAGLYRVFADFTPAATQRGLYASADLQVGSSGAGSTEEERVQPTSAYAEGGYRFELHSLQTPTAGKIVDFSFSVARSDGGAVKLEPVMGAFAHLVAFDESRSGFAHLHPNEIGLNYPLDAAAPTLTFKVTFPRPGKYVVWAQVRLKGSERFVPFGIEVGPN